MTRTCTGAQGLMSGNAIAPSFSPTFFAGIAPATILQKMHSSMATSEELLRIEQQGHRALVDDADLHAGAEDALADLEPSRPETIAELRVERLRHFGARRVGESWPGPLPGVPEERELGHREHPAAGVEHRAVHLPFLVLEDPQVGHLVGQPARVVLGIRLPDAHQDAESPPDAAGDGAVDEDRGLAHPLYDRAHGRRVSASPLRCRRSAPAGRAIRAASPCRRHAPLPAPARSPSAAATSGRSPRRTGPSPCRTRWRSAPRSGSP